MIGHVGRPENNTLHRFATLYTNSCAQPNNIIVYSSRIALIIKIIQNSLGEACLMNSLATSHEPNQAFMVHCAEVELHTSMYAYKYQNYRQLLRCSDSTYFKRSPHYFVELERIPHNTQTLPALPLGCGVGVGKN